MGLHGTGGILISRDPVWLENIGDEEILTMPRGKYAAREFAADCPSHVYN
jgi:hypothetical protein